MRDELAIQVLKTIIRPYNTMPILDLKIIQCLCYETYVLTNCVTTPILMILPFSPYGILCTRNHHTSEPDGQLGICYKV